MITEYVRENGRTYLKTEEEPCMDCMQMKMLMENTTDNFLTITSYRINDKVYYKYNVSSMMVMSSVFEDSEMHAGDIISLISSIRMAVAEADRYLIESDGIRLDPDRIFRDESGNWKFVFFPSPGQQFEEGLRNLFEFIIRHVCHKDSVGSAMAYGIYKRICDGENDLGRLFETEENEEAEAAEINEEKQVIESVIPQPVQEEKEVPDKLKIYIIYGIGAIWAMAVIVFLAGMVIPGVRIRGMSSGGCFLVLMFLAAGGYIGIKWYLRNKDSFFRIKTEDKAVPFEQDNVRILIPKEKQKKDEEYTVVLNNRQEKPLCSLIWEENECSRSYTVNSSVCIIGSSADKADCVINAEGVSRAHARISREGDRFFVKDLNSTNGTTVNNKALACYEICEIKRGDIIMLGNVKCVFN